DIFDIGGTENALLHQWKYPDYDNVWNTESSNPSHWHSVSTHNDGAKAPIAFERTTNSYPIIDVFFPETHFTDTRHLIFKYGYEFIGAEDVSTGNNSSFSIGGNSRYYSYLDIYRVNPSNGHVEQNAGVASSDTSISWAGWSDLGAPGPQGQSAISAV